MRMCEFGKLLAVYAYRSFKRKAMFGTRSLPVFISSQSELCFASVFLPIRPRPPLIKLCCAIQQDVF